MKRKRMRVALMGLAAVAAAVMPASGQVFQQEAEAVHEEPVRIEVSDDSGINEAESIPVAPAFASGFEAAAAKLDEVYVNLRLMDACSREGPILVQDARTIRIEAIHAEMLQVEEEIRAALSDKRRMRELMNERSSTSVRKRMEKDYSEASAELADLERRRDELGQELEREDREAGREMRALERLIATKREQLANLEEGMSNWDAALRDGVLTLKELETTREFLVEYRTLLKTSETNWDAYFYALDTQVHLRRARAVANGECFDPSWPPRPPQTKNGGSF